MNKNNQKSDTWYAKFTDKKTERKDISRPQKKHTVLPGRLQSIPGKPVYLKPQPHKISCSTLYGQEPLFPAQALAPEAQYILDNFDSIIQGVKPLSSKYLSKLSLEIRNLSHELTDERSQRRVGYMNETAGLTAYIRYFMWWNLVRLTRLFSGPGVDAMLPADNDICLDIGSGPLTVPIALWLAKPAFRTRKLVWYCLDISQAALSAGEELYLSIAAKTIAANPDISPWKIIRIKGETGTEIRQKAGFITCANMFNELSQRAAMPPDYLAKKYTDSLNAYAEKNRSTVLVVEPGVPHSARLLSLMRDSFLRRGYSALSPCPHSGTCPMDGKTGGKWCNFAFTTENAPHKLLKLSESADIPKERAVLSFIVMTNSQVPAKKPDQMEVRIVSDPIKLPENRTGFYACSELGLTLVISSRGKQLVSGDLLTLNRPDKPAELSKDAKTGAVELYI